MPVPNRGGVYVQSIQEVLTPPGDYPADTVAGYLDAGHPMLDVMELTQDVVRHAFQVPGGSSVLTDGEYAWRLDLAQYVRRYAPELPEAFLSRALDPAGVPALPQDRLIALSDRIAADLGFRAS
ncbi:hypothetical protein FH609_027220 [Streptomyces sp. 3MP-14]|uniref:Uncharacterized protein n=1 Tax=Streptomyces mimosae TaxID=2586635 RepID=A0A5N5ZZM4_9ACTN|nr:MULTISPECIES: hypothetical protein [Streptomyces]KAB8161382.1 hypothetical protein FH607_025175 [Streptomyces mimosae]KAB8173294.1 hypothetical protein FH609_027220 [Streptomyces sp. 3MP-14]